MLYAVKLRGHFSVIFSVQFVNRNSIAFFVDLILIIPPTRAYNYYLLFLVNNPVFHDQTTPSSSSLFGEGSEVWTVVDRDGN